MLPTLTVRKAEGVEYYNTGEARKPGYDKKTRRVKPPPHIERQVIAWDMEGISLSGPENPQHPVIFGCSLETDAPLTGQRLTMRDMLEYIISVGKKYPHALHVGFAFKYDANMIIYGLSEQQIVKLWKSGVVTFRFDRQFVWSIKWIPGKMFTVTKRWGQRVNTRAKTSVTIYDYSSFFGGMNFINTAEEILRDEFDDDDRDVVAHGKKARGHQTWEDFTEILHYWQREIVLIQRVFEKFRHVMYRAGFPLTEWYGPGALANFINASKKIRPHMASAQTTSGALPPEVHEASKIAFSGGRFELFKAGRVEGPIYAVDINSAYPFALTLVPSLSMESGEWVHVSQPSSVSRFGVYRIRFRAPNASPLEYRPMPLFWRDNRGMVSYPQMVHGWYWSPEAALAQRMRGTEIIEGWEWRTNNAEYPWEFLRDMYDTRMRLGKKNLLSMPFKLGPNSLYGKYAQTVGWDQKKKLPPKSHALPIAGWVTSYCRAMLYAAMMKKPQHIVAVETDAIYSLVPPDELGITVGDGLGQWGYDVYDEMMYIQSGMYHYKKNGVWQGVRSRGISRAEYPAETAIRYLQSLEGGEPWSQMKLTTKPRFIGAGAALAGSIPTKLAMTSWRIQEKEMTLGDTGKRQHVMNACKMCRAGISPWDQPHPMLIQSRSDGETLSYPRRLPWEGIPHPDEVEEIRRALMVESELILR
jgi:DNA polymerase type B, organellar and viral